MKKINSKTTGFVLGACAMAATFGVTMLMAAGPSETPATQANESNQAQNAPSAHPRGKPDAALPKYDIKLDPKRVALVVTDPQNDFLSPKGVTWGVVGESVTENNTVEHIDQLFAAAHARPTAGERTNTRSSSKTGRP